ncbi:MAG: rod shape-determining protein MreC [Dethiobacteria bacterium]
MKKTTRKMITLFCLVVIFLILIFFTGNFRPHYTFAEDLFLTGISPVQGFFSQLGNDTFHFFRGIFGYFKLVEENEKLKRELASQNDYFHRMIELQKENYRLREMLEFRKRTKYHLLPAEVIARSPDNWFETITVNKGYSDGVKVNMAVVTSNGLVGNIMQVARNSSQVLLLTDSRRAVSALVQRSRDPGIVGIVEGYQEKEGYLRMVNLPPEVSIRPGDTIISSGLGGIFPKGLTIGRVLEIGKDQYGLLQQALIQPAVNFDRLEEIFIIMEVPEEQAVEPPFEDESDGSQTG